MIIVNCAGLGSLSGLRNEDKNTNLLLADGSVHLVTSKVKLATWIQLTDKVDSIPLPNAF